jgi:hypothetical protein
MTELLHSTVILGRVPGFRKADVEHAFASSIHRDLSVMMPKANSNAGRDMSTQ